MTVPDWDTPVQITRDLAVRALAPREMELPVVSIAHLDNPPRDPADLSGRLK
jgi:hypothetical protein